MLISGRIDGDAPVRSAARGLPTGVNPYLEAPARIMRYSSLLPDVRLFDVRFAEPSLAEAFDFRPGQFVMLSILGVGEGPFSLPSSPTRRGAFQLAIRRVGVLTDYLFDHVREGDVIGIRGPLGNGFPVERLRGSDLLLVAGGLGMVPLRGLLQYVIDLRHLFGRVMLLYGARTPDQILFAHELASLARRGDAEVLLSVDRDNGLPWTGKVGVVTELLDDVRLDVTRTHAVACGPPVFYKFMLERLVKLGFAKDRIYVSLERRMECGVGKCGHCAIGYTFTCLHGPVFSYWDALNLPELIYT
ncbi:MAG TPA: FAD/NAD(P)-binding protein [Vicinamibacteria bacterium]|nr:FAD/NAD(P)-binding protein [Vicinamibacteria bacterium]